MPFPLIPFITGALAGAAASVLFMNRRNLQPPRREAGEKPADAPAAPVSTRKDDEAGEGSGTD